MTPDAAFAATAGSMAGIDVRQASIVSSANAVFCLADTPGGRRLLVHVLADAVEAFAPRFEGDLVERHEGRMLVCRLTAANAVAMRSSLAWLRPRPLGLRTSAGLGDRLGLATPGHIRALRAAGGSIAPVLAQQSVRENARTGRAPADVLDSATWGAFAEGWQEGYGADADHLKAREDIDAFSAAGFTWFTADPGALVDAAADHVSQAQLRDALAALPWTALDDTQLALWERYIGHRFEAGDHVLRFDDATLARAAVKYGAAIAHVADLYRHVLSARRGAEFDFEVSVDETDTPTSPLEHFYVARELARLGVRCTSLAPKLPGSFEKGIDYRGPIEPLADDLAAHAAIARAFGPYKISLAPRLPGAFEKGIDYRGPIEQLADDLAAHAAIARALGPYKISLHSGSDKFSIYGLAAELTRGAVHLKTAGTSYLEALRTIARVDPGLFREIFRFALDHYEADRASYHVSATLSRARRFESAPDHDVPAALDSDDARQVLHVTYGSVLNQRDDQGRFLFADRLFAALHAHREGYAAALQAHFTRHLAPFAQAGA